MPPQSRFCVIHLFATRVNVSRAGLGSKLVERRQRSKDRAQLAVNLRITAAYTIHDNYVYHDYVIRLHVSMLHRLVYFHARSRSTRDSVSFLPAHTIVNSHEFS